MRSLLGPMIALSAVLSAGAASINIGTDSNAGAWAVDSDGSSFTAFQVGSAVSVTSNGNRLGTTPLNLATWDGVWKATLTFILPSDATNVELNTTAIGSDDKAIFALNGADFADHIIQDGAGAGTFFRNGASENVSYTSSQAVSLTSGFLLGGVNTLVVYINNTDSTALNAPPSNFTFDAAGTGFVLAGTVTFDEPVTPTPEPQTVLLIAGCLSAILIRRSR